MWSEKVWAQAAPAGRERVNVAAVSSMSAQSRDDALAAPDAARASGASTGRARRTGARGAPPVPKLNFENDRKFYTESVPAKSQIFTVLSPEAVAR